jgi:hypothetical protein
VAPPDDQQIVCITLETNIVFARRVATHLANCPRSSHVRGADAWRRTGLKYTAQFIASRRSAAIADSIPERLLKTREEPVLGLFSVQLSNPSAERRAA